MKSWHQQVPSWWKRKRILKKELRLFFMVLVTLIFMQVNKLEGQWLKARENWLLTNDTLCSVWTGLPLWRFVQIVQIKSYRLPLIYLYSKECISLRTDLKASDGLELNWCCYYDHYVDAYKSSTQQIGFQIFPNVNGFKAQKHQT